MHHPRYSFDTNNHGIRPVCTLGIMPILFPRQQCSHVLNDEYFWTPSLHDFWCSAFLVSLVFRGAHHQQAS